MKLVVSVLTRNVDDFGVALAFDVKLGVVGQGVVEIRLIIFLEKGRVGDIADTDLDLPVIGEEMLVFPLDSSAQFRGRLDLGP